MATDDMGDWRELFDIALFEPDRTELRHQIERATNSIKSRLEALMEDHSEREGVTSERLALHDALTTLAQLRKIVYGRRAGANATELNGRPAGAKP